MNASLLVRILKMNISSEDKLLWYFRTGSVDGIPSQTKVVFFVDFTFKIVRMNVKSEYLQNS